MLIDGDALVVYKINGERPIDQVRLIEFEHLQEDDKLHKAVFKFENGNNRFERFNLDRFFKEGNKIEFVYGYIGDLSPVYEYQMKKFKGFRMITVEAFPIVKDFDVPETRTFDSKKGYKKISDVVKFMGKEMNLDVSEVQETLCNHKSLKQNAESNSKWIKSKARELNFEFGYEGGKLIFRQRNYKQDASTRFIYNDGRILGDIVKFEPEYNALQIPSFQSTNFINDETGNVELLGANNESVRRQLLGAGNSVITGAAAGLSGGRFPDTQQKTEDRKRGG